MTICLSFDTETSIGTTVHGPSFRDIGNDMFTQIFAKDPNNVKIVHNSDGFKRHLCGSRNWLSGVDVLIGHNLSFDLCYVWHDPQLKEFILRGGKIWDCQVAEYLLTGQQHCFASLAELQLKYLGQKEKPSRISYLYSKGIGADKIVKAARRCPKLFALYSYYCKTDGSTPLLIAEKQRELAEQRGMIAIIELYNDYLLGIINMTCTGIPIDVELTEKTLKDFSLKHLDWLEKAQELVAPMWVGEDLPNFNINSPDHKSAILFGGNIKTKRREVVGTYKNGKPKEKWVPNLTYVKGFGVPPSLTKPSKKEGVYSTEEAILRVIAEKAKNPVLKQYLEAQKQGMMYKKAAKTYCQAFLDRNVNGVLHANFNNTLTATTRLSSSEPNLQNVSKKHVLGKELHRLFVAPKGWKFVSVDFAQLEIWVLAWLSKDPLLTQHLLNGIDLHVVRLGYYNEDKSYSELYELAKGENKEPYWELQRSHAKTVSYQMAYGAQPKKVAQSTGLPLEVVEKIFEKEAQTYTESATLAERVKSQIETSAKYSSALDIPRSLKSEKTILGNVELLPIFDKDGNTHYNKQDIRRVGYWQSDTGLRCSFLDTGRYTKNGVQRSFSFTQPKNYPMQSHAAIIQGMTTAALLRTLVAKEDKVKMCLEIHDSKCFLVREDVLEPVCKWLKDTIEDVPKLMKQRFGIDVPFKFPIDFSVGDNLTDVESYEVKQ